MSGRSLSWGLTCGLWDIFLLVEMLGRHSVDSLVMMGSWREDILAWEVMAGWWRRGFWCRVW